MSDILSVFDDVELYHPPVITRDSLLKAVRGLMDASRDDWARGDATVTTISDGTFDTILDALHALTEYAASNLMFHDTARFAAAYIELRQARGHGRRPVTTMDTSSPNNSGWQGRMLARYRGLEGLSRTDAAYKCHMGEGTWAKVEENRTYPTEELRNRILAGTGYPERFFRLTEDEWNLEKDFFVGSFAGTGGKETE